MKRVAGYTLNIPDPLRQGDIEQYHLFFEIYEAAAIEGLQARVPKIMRGMVPAAIRTAEGVQRSVIVKSAAACGWVEGLEPADVENLDPGVVRALAVAIWQPIARAQQIPKG